MAKETISVRLEGAEVDRLDRLAEALSERAQGARITRSNALRVAVEEGISELEVKLGIVKRKR